MCTGFIFKTILFFLISVLLCLHPWSPWGSAVSRLPGRFLHASGIIILVPCYMDNFTKLLTSLGNLRMCMQLASRGQRCLNIHGSD